jgi:putative lipoprotein
VLAATGDCPPPDPRPESVLAIGPLTSGPRRDRAMLRSCVRTLAALASIAVLGGCALNGADKGTGDPVQAEVSGTVTYRERIALPATAVITVKLVDVSRADAPAIVLGEQVIASDGRQVPFEFVIGYDPGRIEEGNTYAVQARIEDGGKLLFINDQHHAVITSGAPRRVEMTLIRVRQSTETAK